MPDRWIDDRVGAETTPRPGFEEELASTLSAAWRGEVVPSSRAPEPPRPPRARLVGVAAALLVVIAGVVAFAVVRSGRDDTPAAPIDTVGTTQPATSSTSPATTITTVPGPLPTAPATLLPPTSPVITSLPPELGSTTLPPETTTTIGTTGATPEEQTVLDYLGALADGRWEDAARLLGEGGLDWESRWDLRPLFGDDGTLPSLPDALRTWCESGGLCMRPAAITTADFRQIVTFRLDGVDRTAIFRGGSFEGSPMVSGLPLRIPPGASILDTVRCPLDPVSTRYGDLDGDGWDELLVLAFDAEVRDAIVLSVCGTSLVVSPVELNRLPDVVTSIEVVDIAGDGTDEVVVASEYDGVRFGFVDYADGRLTGITPPQPSDAATRDLRVTVGCLADRPGTVVVFEWQLEGGTDLSNSDALHYEYQVIGSAAEAGGGDIALPTGIDEAHRIIVGYCSGLPVQTEG